MPSVVLRQKPIVRSVEGRGTGGMPAIASKAITHSSALIA